MHSAIQLAVNLDPSPTLVHKTENLPVCAKGISRLNTIESSSSLPSTLIQYPIEERVKTAERKGVHRLVRILSNVFAVTMM